MTTREKFKETLYDYRQACSGIYDESPSFAAGYLKEALEHEESLLAAYDAQAARIAELEAALADVAHSPKNLVPRYQEAARALLDKEA
jgi:hypothetical protein